MYQTRYVTNRSINRMGLNINKKFECFTEAIEENPKIDLIKYINQEIGEIGDTQHRIILRYDNEFIPVVKNIIADFNLTNNIKS